MKAKPKPQMKPFKAWVVLDADGNPVHVTKTRTEIRLVEWLGARVVRVEVREVAR